MPITLPRGRSALVKRKIVRLNDFSGGLNNLFSPLLIGDKELSDVQNIVYEEKGTLKKRLGYTKRYAAAFDSSAVRGLYNYRKEDGTSRLIIGAGSSLYYDKPQFVLLYDTEADWETAGVQTSGVSTVVTAGDITLQNMGMLGQFLLGASSALLGGFTAVTRSGTWRSPAIDLSTVTDKASGVVTIVQTVPASTTVTVETRTSADGSSWSAYVGLGASNTIVSASNTYLQIRVTMTSTTTANPSVQSLQVTFDTTATVSVLATGLSMVARWAFATQNDILYIVNGSDANRRWDGTTFTTQGGTPPVGKYIAVHKNIMFIAGTSTNRSRLYFSSLGDPETWPALNFVDVGKGDGDQITGLAIHLDQLVVTKNNSTWVLQGDASANFVLRRATDESGAFTGSSFAIADNSVFLLARDGVRVFDGQKTVQSSQKIQGTIAGLNQKQLALAAGVVFNPNQKGMRYYLSVPEGTATYNNVVLVFDVIRAAWTVYRGLAASEFVVWRQQNQDHLLFGSATTGQVYEMELSTATSDDGAAIDSYFVTKSFDFGATENVKLFRTCYVTAKEANGGVTSAAVSFFKDLGTESSAVSLSLTGAENMLRALPSTVGVSTIRNVAVKVRNNSATQTLNVYALALEIVPKGVRTTA